MHNVGCTTKHIQTKKYKSDIKLMLTVGSCTNHTKVIA